MKLLLARYVVPDDAGFETWWKI